MLWLLWVLVCAWSMGVARAGDHRAHEATPVPPPSITQVLHRSQQARLDSLPYAEWGTPAAVEVRLDLQRLISVLGLNQPVEVRIVGGDTVAETLHGNVIVANEALAALPDGERLFILAHELGHVVMGHWSQMGDLYRRFIPGKVTPAQTDAVAEALGRAASDLARRQEFDADAYALRTLRALGYADAQALSALSRFGIHRDTATHPGTRQRLAALRAIGATPLDSSAVETAGLSETP
jgi:Zn-dependent protease with chaperone function